MLFLTYPAVVHCCCCFRFCSRSFHSSSLSDLFPYFFPVIFFTYPTMNTCTVREIYTADFTMLSLLVFHPLLSFLVVPRFFYLFQALDLVRSSLVPLCIIT